MIGIDFAQPEYLYLLIIPFLYIAIVWIKQWHQKRKIENVADWDQLQRLLPDGYLTRSRWSICLLFFAMLFLVIALARPRFGQENISEISGGVDLCIALDLSKSMYAQDIAPNRLKRARSEVDELLTNFRGGRICTVVFAGSADVYPLTADKEAVRFFLRDLVPEDMPVGGTSLTRAIVAAVKALSVDENEKEYLPKPPKVLLLITDGEETKKDIQLEQAITLTKEAGVKIYALGVGGTTPEPIPEIKDGKMVGYQENGEARSSLDEDLLRRLAEETGGRYVSLEQGLSPIESELYALGEGFWEEQARTSLAERYAWFLLPAILLLIGEMWLRRRQRKSL